MKKIATLAFSSLFGLGVLIAAPQNQGDQNQNTTPPAKEPAHRPKADPQREVNRLGRKLNLTDDQKNQILPILTERQQTMRSIHQDSSLSAEDRKAKMHSAWEDSDAKIKAVLNDQQKQKYEEMQQARRERMNHHREQGPTSAQPQS